MGQEAEIGKRCKEEESNVWKEYEEEKEEEGEIKRDFVLFEPVCSLLNVVTSDAYPFPSLKTCKRNTDTQAKRWITVGIAGRSTNERWQRDQSWSSGVFNYPAEGRVGCVLF